MRVADENSRIEFVKPLKAHLHAEQRHPELLLHDDSRANPPKRP
jgi:hypothetical protein